MKRLTGTMALTAPADRRFAGNSASSVAAASGYRQRYGKCVR
jgi:hypothetical protein